MFIIPSTYIIYGQPLIIQRINISRPNVMRSAIQKLIPIINVKFMEIKKKLIWKLENVKKIEKKLKMGEKLENSEFPKIRSTTNSSRNWMLKNQIGKAICPNQTPNQIPIKCPSNQISPQLFNVHANGKLSLILSINTFQIMVL